MADQSMDRDAQGPEVRGQGSDKAHLRVMPERFEGGAGAKALV